MSVVLRGRVRSGTLELSDPVPIPEGTEVVVSIDTVSAPTEAEPMSEADFLSLPFFGMWADRDEMQDSVAWVREMREGWQRRTNP